MTQPLLDESTFALDAQPEQVFETTARDLAAQGIIIIWVTHDDAQARWVASRICLLRDGQMTGALTERQGQFLDCLRPFVESLALIERLGDPPRQPSGMMARHFLWKSPHGIYPDGCRIVTRTGLAQLWMVKSALSEPICTW